MEVGREQQDKEGQQHWVGVAPSPRQFLGETDMNGSPSRGKHTVGSCLVMDDVAVAEEKKIHTQEARAAH